MIVKSAGESLDRDQINTGKRLDRIERAEERRVIMVDDVLINKILIEPQGALTEIMQEA